jgi:hypothetical protein
MTRDDALFLIVASSVPRKFKNFGGKIFKHGSEVY